jgi:maltooligosyltrehalose trehalohydrolase
MLFMGQEYGETAPFLYFTSHSDPELAEAVRRGRAEEFVSFKWNREFADPQDEGTFHQSKLDWALPQRPRHAALLALHRDLLQLRRDSPSLHCCRKDLTRVEASESKRWLSMERRAANGSSTLCLYNFADRAARAPVALGGRRLLLAIWTGDTRYGTEAGTTPPLQVLDGSVNHVVLPPETAVIYTSHS